MGIEDIRALERGKNRPYPWDIYIPHEKTEGHLQSNLKMNVNDPLYKEGDSNVYFPGSRE